MITKQKIPTHTSWQLLLHTLSGLARVPATAILLRVFAINSIMLGWKTYKYHMKQTIFGQPEANLFQEKWAKNGKNRTSNHFFRTFRGLGCRPGLSRSLLFISYSFVLNIFFVIFVGWVLPLGYEGVRWCSHNMFSNPTQPNRIR